MNRQDTAALQPVRGIFGNLISQFMRPAYSPVNTADTALQQTVGNPHSCTCTKHFQIGEIAYTCRDCANRPGVALCVDCFHNSTHKTHQYQQIVCSENGSSCSCTKEQDWKTFSHGYEQLGLQALAKAVVVPLKTGLRSFNNISEMLLSVNADMVLPGCQTFDEIRQEIDNMKMQMEESEQVAKAELQRVDGDTERCTAEHSELARQKREREGELGDLKTQLDSHKTSLDNYNRSLRDARRNQAKAEETLRDMRAKRDEAERLRNIGIGLMFIPFAGLIAGATMVGVGQVDMNRLSEASDNARREVQNCEGSVQHYSNEVSNCSSRISNTERDIQVTDSKIKDTEYKLRDLAAKREVVADVQEKMRRVVHQLGLVSGVASVAELQTRRLVLMEPMMAVMEEMNTTLSKIAGNELMQAEGIQSLMGEMRGNQAKLQEKAQNALSDELTDLM